MKTTLLAVGITTAAMAVSALAEDQHPNRAAKAQAKSRSSTAASASVRNASGGQRSRQVGVRQDVSARSFRNQNFSGQTAGQNRVMRSNVNPNRVTTRERGFRRAQETTANNFTTNAATSRRFARQQNFRAERNFAGTTNPNVTINRTRNVNRNVTLVNNWNSNRFAGRSYTAFRTYHRAWHDRGWWDTHYGPSLTFVFGAPYFWSSGYWYPAWGYNPGYVYPYDGPIYGAATLSPDQIVMNVQAQLRDDGYYTGPIDGVLGPQTRYALAAFQADNGLAVTSAVDEPTLASLGLS